MRKLNCYVVLGIATVVVTLLISFPSYSGVFFPKNQALSANSVKEGNLVKTRLFIDGMTCTGCEQSVNHALSKQNGVVEATSSHTDGIAIVSFDKSKVNEEQLSQAILDEVGYKVKRHERIN